MAQSTTIDLGKVIGNIILPAVRETIMLHEGRATYDQLVRNITLKLLEKGLLHHREIRDLNYEEIFDKYLERIGRSKIWKLKVGEKVSPIDFIPLTRRIEWIIRSVFSGGGGKAKPDQIFSAIFTNLRNANTPENEEIMSVLKRLAEPMRIKEGKKESVYWVAKEELMREEKLEKYMPAIKPVVTAPEMMAIDFFDHDSMITIIAKVGHALDFDVWIGETEVRRNSDLKNFVTINRLEIAGVDTLTLDRLRNIDVIWLMRKTIPYALFEVEHTTDVRGGIVRMANVFELLPHLSVQSVIVLPDDRVREFEKVTKEPSIIRVLSGRDILCVTYSIMARVADDVDRKRIGLNDVINACRHIRIEHFS